jgi:hypothetical protein
LGAAAILPTFEALGSILDAQADFRCRFATGFLATVSFTGSLPSIGSSASFCPAAFFGFVGAFAGSAWQPLRRSAPP